MVPMASALGAALASGTFLLTTSFVVTTPGITLTSPTGLPTHLNPAGDVLLKDVALLGGVRYAADWDRCR